jgi:hypothetical protein
MKRAIIILTAVAVAIGAVVTMFTVSPQTAREIILTAVTVAIAFGAAVTVLTVTPETAVACDGNDC